MIRKSLTILSLIGLLLSVGAWGMSWYGISIGRHSTTRLDSVDLADGILWYVWERTNSEELKTVGKRRATEWTFLARKGPLIQLASGMHSRWVPSYHGPLTGTISAMWLPLYLPVLFFAILAHLCAAALPPSPQTQEARTVREMRLQSHRID